MKAPDFSFSCSHFRYQKNRPNKHRTKIYWRCADRDNCSGSITSNFNVGRGHIIVQRGLAHTHEADHTEIRVQEVVRGIKRRAEQHPNEPPSRVFLEAVAGERNEEVLANLPQRNDMIRTIHRVQSRRRPAHPQSLQELHIQPPYTTTLNGETFMQFDSGEEDPDRFFMFYTARGLAQLCNSRMILADGTFKTVPRMFFQLYTIHGNVLEHTFPLVYVLATRKNENFYRRMLEQLRNHAVESNSLLSPQHVMSDFELAFLNAAQEVFPQCSTHACLFHYTQSIWKQTMARGLKVPYLEIPEVRHIIQYMLALPFIPLDDIPDVFDAISDEAARIVEDDGNEEILHNLTNLIDYVETFYIRGRPARGRRRAAGPRFEPILWNVYQLVLQRQNRTTNAAEGWHSRFQKLIISHHSGIWKFLEHLQKDQHNNEVCITQLSAGHTRTKYPIKGKYKRNQEMIETIVGNYNTYKDDNNTFQYLRAIAYKIKLHATEENEEEDE